MPITMPNTMPITKPNITIDESLKESVAQQHDDESQVIVHCYYPESAFESQIRIWPSTFLIDLKGGTPSKLLLVDNISIMPQWTFLPPFKGHRFTLYFAGLPKSCSAFDLVEEIPEPGAFIVRGIPRNQTDVYHLHL